MPGCWPITRVFADCFLPDGASPNKGQVFRNPRLAGTYKLLAAGGREVFYRGEIAWKIAAYMREHGGYLDEADLASHRSEWVTPVSAAYRGHDIYALPPNTQGIATLQILNLLEPYDLASAGFGSAEHLHLLTEAKKLAFEDRARFYADPSFVATPVDELISRDYARERGKLIDPTRAATAVLHGDPRLDTPQTVYLAAGDRDGMLVSLIQSNYRGMGSGMTPGDLGFVLQNRGQLFNLNPDHPKRAGARKASVSHHHSGLRALLRRRAPRIRRDGRRDAATGAGTGDHECCGTSEWTCRQRATLHAPITAAPASPTGQAAAPDGGKLALEPGFGTEVRQRLSAMGHNISKARGVYGGYQGRHAQ